ncbi:hypothetical protein FA95DRAFT_1545863 [Auriscalpium vulgare]|uniref:Uncharacterized protein n=1 Tax=Auriscalpium vulgare TaxID=40419 RepID=A0ACB8RI63_9AGAM|nr:hypothetical protein FA95DRAFT_1545863 [Auriscalpium vulgare]
MRSPSLTRSDRTASSLSSPTTPASPAPRSNSISPAALHAKLAPALAKGKGRADASQDGVRPRTFSTFIRARPRFSVTNVLQNSAVLHRFLLYAPWEDFRSLAQVSKECMNVFHQPQLKDVVLSRFVPGYSHCLRHADLQAFRVVEVGFLDLDLFMASQQVPLHQYPAHALSMLAALYPDPQQQRKTERLVAMSQAHSRIVLLLQSLTHSSSRPLSDEPDDARLRSPNGLSPARELVFPAPLSYFGAEAAPIPPKTPEAPATKKHGRFPSASAIVPGARPRRSEDSASVRSVRRLSIFGGRKPLPPPPSKGAVTHYVESWRGRRRNMSASEGEDTLLRRPKRRFASVTQSSDSSLENSSPSPSSPIPENTYTPPTPSSPHDILMATSRLRAPVLRVFFPCSQLDQDQIAHCETQLEDAGLWEHLSTGDIVCNLGFLPPEDVPSSSSDLSSDHPAGTGLWLLFDGMQLVPYAPHRTLPLAEPHLLPSPLYYAHITPRSVNSKLSMVLPRADPQLALALLPTQVRSPHSPNGVAHTRKYMWLAHVHPRRRPGLGEGWHGEWVLEGAGTKEGRQELLDALRGDAGDIREWELVIDKCSASRIWLRLSIPGASLPTAPSPPTHHASWP